MSAHPTGLLALGALLAPIACTTDIPVLTDAPPEAPRATPPSEHTLASRWWHTCAVAGDGTWCWGRNDHDALGGFTGTSSEVPVKLATSSVFQSLSLGEDFGCGLDASGALACWGSDIHGQLGQGDSTDRPAPTTVPMARATRLVSAGSNHVCAIDMAGSLWCWGYNQENGIGVGGTPGQGVDVLSPVQVGVESDWTSISAGDGHTCGIRAGGALYCWGRDSEDECGQGAGSPAQITTPTRVGARSDWLGVSAGEFGTCALDAALTIWCWGQNTYETLDNPAASLAVPTALALPEGTLEIGINAFTTWARSTSGALSGWGLNQFGELGLGDTSPRATPQPTFPGVEMSEVALGRQHTCVREMDGSVWCAGRNLEGQLGNGSDTSSSTWVEVTIP